MHVRHTAMVVWCYGAMVLQCYGATVLRCYGDMVLSLGLREVKVVLWHALETGIVTIQGTFPSQKCVCFQLT